MTNILKNISRYKQSILPSEIEGDEILRSVTLAQVKESNSMTELLEVDTTRFQKIYLVSTAHWGFDSVDEILHAFRSKDAAEACYQYYNLPISELRDRITQPTVKFITPDGEVFKVCDEYQGYVVQNFYDGDFLRPLYSKKILIKNGWFEDPILRNMETDIRSLIGTKYEIALLRYDREVGGIKVEREKVIRFYRHSCWETGLRYLELAYLYPEEVFNAMKPFLQYHNEEIEEEGDWKGWYVLQNSENIKNLKQALARIGWEINEYEDSTSDDD